MMVRLVVRESGDVDDEMQDFQIDESSQPTPHLPEQCQYHLSAEQEQENFQVTSRWWHKHNYYHKWVVIVTYCMDNTTPTTTSVGTAPLLQDCLECVHT